MNIDRRITNGLAWAGVLLVVGVPTADLLSAQFMGNPPAPAQIAVMAPVAPIPAPLSQRPAAPVAKPAAQVAAVTPAKPVATPAKPTVTPAAQTADAVDAFLQSGRQMPSYITDADAPAAPSQVAATPPTRPLITTTPPAQPAAVDPIEVASIPQKVAPTPMPLSMRPEPVAVALVRDPVVIPPGLTPAEPDVIVRPPVDVTAADLQDWESGPLAEFLARRQAANAYVEPEADGFFLDQGPKRPRRDRVIAREIDPFFFFGD